jgi:D-isomer specific 2-hydroxyacid dehydrogenase, catalytic domain
MVSQTIKHVDRDAAWMEAAQHRHQWSPHHESSRPEAHIRNDEEAVGGKKKGSKESLRSQFWIRTTGCRILFMKDANSVAEVNQIMAAETVDAVISRTVNLTEDAIRARPTLKVISKHGVGATNIDVEAATERGIPVYVTPAANAQSVVEMAIGLMLAAARKLLSWIMSFMLEAGHVFRMACNSLDALSG